MRGHNQVIEIPGRAPMGPHWSPQGLPRATELDYPIRMLALGMIMHMAPRVVTCHGSYQVVGLPANGIIAGCTQSNQFARVFLFAVMHAMANAVPTFLAMLIDAVMVLVRGL